MVSSIYKKNFTANTPTIIAGLPILSSPVVIGPGELVPASGGLLKIWFSFIFSGVISSIAITKNNNVSQTNLFFVDAEEGFIIRSGGLYSFDIPVEEGDQINLTSTTDPDFSVIGLSITAIKLLRFQLITFGASKRHNNS